MRRGDSSQAAVRSGTYELQLSEPIDPQERLPEKGKVLQQARQIEAHNPGE